MGFSVIVLRLSQAETGSRHWGGDSKGQDAGRWPHQGWRSFPWTWSPDWPLASSYAQFRVERVKVGVPEGEQRKMCDGDSRWPDVWAYSFAQESPTSHEGSSRHTEDLSESKTMWPWVSHYIHKMGRTRVTVGHTQETDWDPHEVRAADVGVQRWAFQGVFAFRTLAVLWARPGVGRENAALHDLANSGDLFWVPVWSSKEKGFLKDFFFPFSFLSTEPFISEKVNAQLEGFSSFMQSCFRLFEHEMIFWSHSTLSEK